MKRRLTTAAFAFILLLGSSFTNTVSAQYNEDDDYNDNGYNDNNNNNRGRDREVSYQTFYDELSPYGRWVQNDDHGYVWVPDAGEDFRPYSTNGHWVWSDDAEWMWVSDYDWGWAPFHYGRWEEDNNYGWYWVPGYEWSPAWVAWRDGGDYYGWAPLRPGINISVNFNIGGYNPPDNYWCFAPRRYITSPRIFDYYVDRRRNSSIIHQTIIINNYNYGGNYGFRTGPRRYDAERYCGRINPVRFRDTYNPGRTFYRNNEVSIYRPNVRRDNDRNFSPRQFDRYDRGSGQFRNIRTDNGVRRNDDNRGNDNGIRRNNGNGRDDNGFRRNDDRRNDNAVNNQQGRRERTDNTPFRRTDDNVRQPSTNGGDNNINNRRRIERTENGNGQPGGDRRINQPEPRRQSLPDRSNNRTFERRIDNGGNNNTPVRQPRVRNESENRQPQRQPAQQMERRQEPRQQPQQQPARQFERRNDNGGSRPSASSNENRRSDNSGGGSNGNGRGRRF